MTAHRYPIPPHPPVFFRNPATAPVAAPILPMTPSGQQEAALRAQREAAKQRLAGLKDKLQLRPLMATVAFSTNEDGLIKAGYRRRAFIDDEGQDQASGIVQHAANSTFGGARTGNETRILKAMAIYVRRNGTRDLLVQESREIRWKISSEIKRAHGGVDLGPIALFPAGDGASVDYEKIRRFDEPIELDDNKHFSMTFTVQEEIQLTEASTVVLTVFFPGDQYIDPVDRAGM